MLHFLSCSGVGTQFRNCEGCTFGASSTAFAKVRAEVRRRGTAASQEDGSEVPRNVPGGVQGEEPEAAKARILGRDQKVGSF